jgi:NAD(P)-dependent dehydrogenase (short-subunit alcohol dehydrogenase family)
MTGPAGLLGGMTALVTGGTRGLGRAIAEGYASAGARVIVVGRRLESCEQAAGEIADATGGVAEPIACHVGHWSEVNELVIEAYRRVERIDVLVNNAGSSPTFPSIAEASEELFDKTVAVNLKGPLRLAALIGTRMVSDGRGGSIINVSSVAADRPRPEYAVYAAAKAGLGAVTSALAQEFAPSVRVNTIMAGPFLTDVTRHWDMSVVGPRLRTYPAGRAGDPAEILGAALYLAGPASTFTTGSVIRVDGGMAIA